LNADQWFPFCAKGGVAGRLLAAIRHSTGTGPVELKPLQYQQFEQGPFGGAKADYNVLCKVVEPSP
jgi:hypothetical protein